MQNLKFRAWDKKGEQMINHVKSIEFDFNGNLLSLESKYDLEVKDGQNSGVYRRLAFEIHLMQYTGLKDNDGKEICEGDIVRSSDGERDYVDVVSFSYIHGVAFGKERYADLGLPHGFTCIGNVWENSDLLNP